jgi:hypothetical protein
MTKRFEALTVVLEEEFRLDDLERTIMNAIRQIEGVAGVQPEGTHTLEKLTLKQQLKDDIIDSVREEFE